MADEVSAPEKLPVFSPSQTTTFGFCPRFWALRLPRGQGEMSETSLDK